MQCRDCKTIRKSEVHSGYCEISDVVLNYTKCRLQNSPALLVLLLRKKLKRVETDPIWVTLFTLLNEYDDDDESLCISRSSGDGSILC